MKKIHYNIDNLITNESFIAWALNPQSDQSAYWENYLKEDNDHSLQVEKSRKFVLQLNAAKTSPTESQIVKTFEHIKSEIKLEKTNKTSVTNWSIIRKVAAIFVCIIFAYFLISNDDKSQINTAFNEMQTINLPDGSQVILNSNSTLSFTNDWEDSSDREVWLQGEAYFKVSKTNSKIGRKFIVYTEDLNVKVLGTQFNVNTHEDKTDVVLEEGKINVEYIAEDIEDSKTFTMLPGQKTSFNPIENKYQVSEVNTLVFTSWKEGTIVFDGTPLSELKNIIENNYGYQVIFEREELLSKKIDGKIDNPNLEALLSTLETIFNLKIEKRGKRIIITE